MNQPGQMAMRISEDDEERSRIPRKQKHDLTSATVPKDRAPLIRREIERTEAPRTGDRSAQQVQMGNQQHRS